MNPQLSHYGSREISLDQKDLIVLGHNLDILAIVDSICQQRKACMRKTGRMQIESRVGVEIRLEGWLDIG